VVRDRDSKFIGPFDEVFRSAGVKIICTPVRAPRANAYAERWVRALRNECLDWLLITNRRHLERVLRIYVEHYNRQRPHRALQLEPPVGPNAPPRRGTTLGVRHRDVLGGLIHEYEPAAGARAVELPSSDPKNNSGYERLTDLRKQERCRSKPRLRR
jgi:putative transposase